MQQLDLNLLLALDVLLKEQSVTAAADKMHLSIPAMSRTLARIRKLMEDPILVRAGMRLVPTPKAVAIQPRLATLMEEARAFLSITQQKDFRKLGLTFTIRAEEGFVILADEMNTMLQAHAPRMKLRLVTRATGDLASLREGLVQLDIGQMKHKGPEVKAQRLFSSVPMGIARSDHPLFQGRITPKRYASYRHVNASQRGVGTTPIDAELKADSRQDGRPCRPQLPSRDACSRQHPVNRHDTSHSFPLRAGTRTAGIPDSRPGPADSHLPSMASALRRRPSASLCAWLRGQGLPLCVGINSAQRNGLTLLASPFSAWDVNHAPGLPVD